jgi:hypothetical protein
MHGHTRNAVVRSWREGYELTAIAKMYRQSIANVEDVLYDLLNGTLEAQQARRCGHAQNAEKTCSGKSAPTASAVT